MRACGIHLMLKGYLKNEFQVAFGIVAGSSINPSTSQPHGSSSWLISAQAWRTSGRRSGKSRLKK